MITTPSVTHRSIVRTPLLAGILTAAIGLAGCQTGADSALPPVVKPDNANFPQTANSITAVANGTRRDPEGVAAESNVNKVTWKDARGADRSMILGGYLYQYDFTFNDNLSVVSRPSSPWQKARCWWTLTEMSILITLVAGVP